MHHIQFTLMHLPILPGRQHLHNCGCDISIKSRYAEGDRETLLAIRSRRYTTVGPVQSAVCNFGQVVGSPCLPVTVCAHGGLGLRYTEVRKPRGTPLCLPVNLAYTLWNIRWTDAHEQQILFGNELSVSNLFTTSVFVSSHRCFSQYMYLDLTVVPRTYSRPGYRNSRVLYLKKDLVSKYKIICML